MKQKRISGRKTRAPNRKATNGPAPSSNVKPGRRGWEQQNTQENVAGAFKGEDDVLALTVGTRIRDLRLKKGLSQAALGGLIGLPATPICQMEHGHRLPSARTLIHLAWALSTSIDSLFTRGPSRDSVREVSSQATFNDGYRLVPAIELGAEDAPPIPTDCQAAADELIRSELSLEELAGVDTRSWFAFPLPYTPDTHGASRLAAQVRSFFGVSQAAIIDPASLAEAAGARILTAEWGSGPHAMVALPPAGDRVFFLLRRRGPQGMGHAELSACALGTAFWEGWRTVLEQHPDLTRGLEKREWIREFVYALILPERLMHSVGTGLGLSIASGRDNTLFALRRMARRFGVSFDTVCARATDLGLIPQGLLDRMPTTKTGHAHGRIPSCGLVAGCRNTRVHDLLWKCLLRRETAPRAEEIRGILKKYMPELLGK